MIFTDPQTNQIHGLIRKTSHLRPFYLIADTLITTLFTQPKQSIHSLFIDNNVMSITITKNHMTPNKYNFCINVESHKLHLALTTT